MTLPPPTQSALSRRAPSRREFLQGTGAIVVGFALAGTTTSAGGAPSAGGVGLAPPRPLVAGTVDGFIEISANGRVTLFSGKVDLGQGLPTALRQMAAEELAVPIEVIDIVTGDTALTPDQGATGGSQGVKTGGMQIRRAAATARQALLRLGAEQLKVPEAEVEAVEGAIRLRADPTRKISYAALIGDKRFGLKSDDKATLIEPAKFMVIGQPVRREDIPDKVTGRFTYMQDLRIPGMLHARTIRPPAVGAELLAVDADSLKGLPGNPRAVRLRSFLAVVADHEWGAVRGARELKASWSAAATLPEQDRLYEHVRATPIVRDEVLGEAGDVKAASGGKTLSAVYQWPIQTHGSIGPSCGVADVTRESATVWTASQSTHKYWPHFARTLGLPVDKVRLVYVEGSGCYGMNGHEDAAIEAALLSQLLGRPVRVQWMREDEHGWDPKGPPQMLELRGTLDASGKIVAWDSQTWLPEITKGLPNIPLLAPEAAGIDQPQGESSGQVQQNTKPPYRIPNLRVVAHWLKDTPLRPSHLRAPGRMANILASEAFMDELALAADADPLEFRLRHLADKRGIELLTRTAARANWVARPSPNPAAGSAGKALGRGLTYIQYNNAETYVAMVLELEVARDSGAIRVARVVVGHDCGLAVNPDGARNQIEGAVLQSISRALHEEITFDRSRVTSLDWSSYRLLTFPEMPTIEHEFVQRLDQPPWGVGEPATTLAAAAISNAVFDATGVRLRQAPFTPERVKAALSSRET
jgi:nicotinate dehydrogenase subunit B